MNAEGKSLSANEERYIKLKRERMQEIKRDGVAVFACQSEMDDLPFFICEDADIQKLEDLVSQDTFPLQLCEENGYPLFQFTKDNAYLSWGGSVHQPRRLIIAPIPEQLQMNANRRYYVAKRNTSISVHKSILSSLHHDQLALVGQSKLIKQFIDEQIEEIPNKDRIEFQWQKDLNERQNQAVIKTGMNALTFIKGPPGCGKTKTIARICRLMSQAGQKVIVGTVSNTGNISILNELIKQMLAPYQVGIIQNIYQNWERRQFQLEQYATNVQQHLRVKIVLLTNLQTKLQNNQYESIKKYFSVNQWLIRNVFLINNARDLSFQEIEDGLELIAQKKVKAFGFYKKIYSLYKQALKKTIEEADIIITTTVLSATIKEKVGGKHNFRPKVAILDEASQATWADTLCFLYYNVQRLILVGDDKQLDPTVISQDKLLKQTVFGKLSQKKEEYFVMLNTQYRMHPQICQFPNFYFYESKLLNGVTADQRHSNVYYFSDHPIAFLTHSSVQEYFEQGDSGKKNYHNRFQRGCIRHLLSLFPKDELKNVGIISPYGLQVRLLAQQFARQILYYDLTIKTCDGYQGGEKDYIIFSCVRANQKGKIGFCAQKNRINVSLTRAKKSLIIVGSKETLSSDTQIDPKDNVWLALIKFLEGKKKIFPAQSVIDEITYYNSMSCEAQIDPKSQGSKNNFASSQEQLYHKYGTSAYSQDMQLQSFRGDEKNLGSDIVYQRQQNARGQVMSEIDSKQHIVKKAIEQLEKGKDLIKDQEEEEESNLKSKNKRQFKQIRKILNEYCKKAKVEEAPAVINKLLELFSGVTLAKDLIVKMTKSLHAQFIGFLKEENLPNCQQELKNLITNLDRQLFGANHIYQGQQACKCIRMSLFHQLMCILF